MENELHPTEEEMAQDYMKTFWIRSTDRMYDGPPVVQVSVREETAQHTVPTTSSHGSSAQFVCDRAHSHHLESQMDQLRNDFANMRTDFGEQLRQQGSDIQEMKTMMHQILQHVSGSHVRNT